jgi:hypothetical protein
MKTFLAIVTFDLHGAKPGDYPRVRRKLAGFRLEQHVQAKKSKTFSRLPANTFVRKFQTAKSARELRDYLRDKTHQIIANQNLRATVFVAIGGHNWAWGRKRF